MSFYAVHSQQVRDSWLNMRSLVEPEVADRELLRVCLDLLAALYEAADNDQPEEDL